MSLQANPSQLQVTTHQQKKTQKLNIDLPLLPKNNSNQLNIKISNNTPIILASAKRFSIKNWLVLNTTKNAVLKAVLKRKSYGLRYTRIW
ncbi:MAG: hypothetical protein KAG34_06310 [Cocleimonas sp.]|nr:hypothetical protein [Cocleimonas sp.]